MQAFGTMPGRGQLDEKGAMRDASGAIAGFESLGSSNEPTRRADMTPRTHQAS